MHGLHTCFEEALLISVLFAGDGGDGVGDSEAMDSGNNDSARYGQLYLYKVSSKNFVFFTVVSDIELFGSTELVTQNLSKLSDEKRGCYLMSQREA